MCRRVLAEPDLGLWITPDLSVAGQKLVLNRQRSRLRAWRSSTPELDSNALVPTDTEEPGDESADESFVAGGGGAGAAGQRCAGVDCAGVAARAAWSARVRREWCGADGAGRG